MGLDTSHNAWHGPYSSFGEWRKWIAKQFNIPLNLMEGFYDNSKGEDYFMPGYGNPFYYAKIRLTDKEYKGIKDIEAGLPIKWESIKKDPIHKLLNHSDCEGIIGWKSCGKIAERLKFLLNNIALDDSPEYGFANEYMVNKTKQFMEGCQLAFEKQERLRFG